MIGTKKFRTPRDKAAATLLTIIFGAIAITMLLPFAWMISASFKKLGDIWIFPVKWIPSYWYPDNYRHIFSMDPSVLTLYWNSIKVTVIAVSGSLVFSCLAAYAYSKMRFPGRNALFMVVLSTLMVPPQAIYVPKFVLFTFLDRIIPLMNNHNSLIIPGMFAALGLFLLKQFMEEIPNELLESAFIDGASHLRVLTSIVLPISKPALASYTIVVFSFHWNDYESALIFIRDKALATLPLGLAMFNDENGLMYNYIMALSVLAILPLFAVFLMGQRMFIQGLTAGALKS